MLLFRHFYKQGRNGDWLTIDKRKGAPLCINWSLSSLKGWKNRFFYVNASLAPIRMRWGLKDEKITDPEPGNECDLDLFVDLQAHPIRARSYPKRVLVLTCLSQHWNRPLFKQCLKLHGEGTKIHFF